MFKRNYIILGLATLAAVSACSPGSNVQKVSGQFWQRVNVSESVYTQGPKAQQMLSRDISRCVVELRELERLGIIKNAIPPELERVDTTRDEQELYDWDAPERDAYLFAEHSDYTDFEGCMDQKGWERVEHVPYDVGMKGRENYLRAHVDYSDDVGDYSKGHTVRQGESKNTGTDGNLNE